MGIDVYLECEGRRKYEFPQPFEAWSIAAGKHGYLRVSGGMSREFKMLDQILFHPSKSKFQFDFIGSEKAIKEALEEYVGLENLKEPITEGRESSFPDFSFSQGSITIHQVKMAERRVWGKSVLDFWALGIKYQREGKNPTVIVC